MYLKAEVVFSLTIVSVAVIACVFVEIAGVLIIANVVYGSLSVVVSLLMDTLLLSQFCYLWFFLIHNADPISAFFDVMETPTAVVTGRRFLKFL